jgi:excinuclease ABC subunit C
MVVFVHGVPSKQDYRRFRIKTVQGADDYASMAEVLSRRFARAGRDGDSERTAGSKRSGSKENRWAIMPDLIIVDGGKGQLNATRDVLAEAGVADIPTAGLAKQEELLFVPHKEAPVRLPRDSQGLYLVQRIRDEAHRFAITYHRKLRRKQGLRSVLEDIPGVGPRRRQSLLKTFGSLDGIRKATVEELAAAPGMNRSVAQRVHESL